MRIGMVIGALVLCAAVIAEAQPLDLYSAEEIQYSSSGSTKRAQHFSPTQSSPNSLAPTDLFDSVAMGIRMEYSDWMVGTLNLYTWQGSWSATTDNSAALLGSTAVNLAGPGGTGNTVTWLEVVPSSDLLASGQYMIELAVTGYSGLTGPAGWGLVKSNSNDGGTNNDAFNASDSAKTDREYQVRLNVVPEPGALALLALGLPLGMRRRR